MAQSSNYKAPPLLTGDTQRIGKKKLVFGNYSPLWIKTGMVQQNFLSLSGQHREAILELHI